MGGFQLGRAFPGPRAGTGSAQPWPQNQHACCRQWPLGTAAATGQLGIVANVGLRSFIE